jgi:hypothetical protein
MIQPPTTCPACKRLDMVQKVSAIYRNGISTRMEFQATTTYASTSDSMGNSTLTPQATFTTVPVTHQTRLSALLRPPRRKNIPLPAGEKFIFWLCPLFALVFYFCLSSFLQSNFPDALDGVFTLPSIVAFFLAIFIFGGALIGPPVLLAILTHKVFFRRANAYRQELYQQQQERQPHLLRQWEQFCYCHRCDCVFSSGKELAVPPQELHRLYSE